MHPEDQPPARSERPRESAEGVGELGGGEVGRVAGFGVRFSGVIFPGETMRVRGWREDDRIVGSATIAGGERDGAPVLGDVTLTLVP